MKPPDNVSPDKLVKQDPNYFWLACQSVDVWPGWMQMHVVRHEPTKTLWAMNEFISDDDSEFRGGWYEVESESKIVYKVKKK